MDNASLDDVFSDLNLDSDAAALNKSITLWVPEEYKAKYDKLQKLSSREFNKRLRTLILKAIDQNIQKAS